MVPQGLGATQEESMKYEKEILITFKSKNAEWPLQKRLFLMKKMVENDVSRVKSGKNLKKISHSKYFTDMDFCATLLIKIIRNHFSENFGFL